MSKPVIVTADKIRKRKKTIKIVKIVFLCILLFLAILFVILSFIYNGGKFVITLDPNSSLESSLALFEDSDYKDVKRKLYAEEINFMDNISIKWLPEDIDNEQDGSHNGQNYIAYTFYIENKGKDVVNYWYEVIIDDVIKNVDNAVRIMIYRNGEKTVYAKINEDTNAPEDGTKPFVSKESAVLEQRKDFKPKDIDKFTIVVWLEGDDPDCVNAIIGGEIKMHMNIIEEHIEQVKQEKDENIDVEEKVKEEDDGKED